MSSVNHGAQGDKTVLGEQMLHKGQKVKMERRRIYASNEAPSETVTTKTVARVRDNGNGNLLVTFRGIRGAFAARPTRNSGLVIERLTTQRPARWVVLTIDDNDPGL